MINIKFIDRKKEIEIIREIKKSNFFLVVKGRRRIGKTRFLKEVFPEAIYIFIWPNKSLRWINKKICSIYNLPHFENFLDTIKYLLDKKKIIVIDEFQNFLSIDKSVYGELQKLIDERKNKYLKIAVAGSSYSLMNKVFNDVASPLYGRRTVEINLSNLPIKDLFKALKIDIEDFIKLWSVFEGVPYYYELINLSIPPEENIKKLVLSKDALLREEGKAVLSLEFGQDSKTYDTVLTAISEGKTKLNEIASLFEDNSSATIKYIDILRKNYNLVRRITPILDNPRKSKRGKYEIIDNFLDFWFYFFDRQKNYIEQERFEEVEGFFDKEFNTYLGKKFEKFILKLLREGLLDPNFTKIGKQWGKFKGEKGKNTYEIDIVALNDDTKEILFAECKWKDNVDAKKILTKLKEKASFVKWNNDKRKEKYAIFAKSFKNKPKGCRCFGLKDIEKVLKI